MNIQVYRKEHIREYVYAWMHNWLVKKAARHVDMKGQSFHKLALGQAYIHLEKFKPWPSFHLIYNK